MKNIIPFTIAAALAASGISQAQGTPDPAFSKPSGYVTQDLIQGFNMLGINLQSSPVASGSFSTVGSGTASDSTKDFTALLAAGSIYILEVTGGSQAGAISEVVSWSGAELTTSDNMALSGIVATDSYVLRKAPTLEEVFGTSNSVLAKSNSVVNADVVWVANGPSQYIRYFQNNAGAWRNASNPGFAPNTPLIYLDGIFIQKKSAGTVSLTVTGEVKTQSVKAQIAQGFNLLGTVYPAGSTLQNIGLESVLVKSNSVVNADVVWLSDGAGGYTRYFLNNAGLWRNATTPGFAPDNVPITSGILIQKKSSGSEALVLVPPTFYSNL